MLTIDLRLLAIVSTPFEIYPLEEVTTKKSKLKVDMLIRPLAEFQNSPLCKEAAGGSLPNYPRVLFSIGEIAQKCGLLPEGLSGMGSSLASAPDNCSFVNKVASY